MKRPIKITDEQKKEILTEVAENIIEWNISNDSIETIVDDLEGILDSNDTGFKMAKEIDESFGYAGNYKMNSTFVELLESIDSLKSDKKRINMQKWVKENNIKPKYKKGDKFTLKVSAFRYSIGDLIYINYLKEDTAHYVVDKDPNRKGGTIVTYEDLERCV